MTDEKVKLDMFSTPALCGRILDRHRSTIRVQKTERAIAKLATIIETTLDLSNRHGFDAMSLRDLAHHSGISMGALYTYFDSKGTLLLMILEEVSSTATSVLADPPGSVTDDPQRHLLWLIDTHLRITEAMQKWFVFAFMEAKTFPLAARRLAIDSEEATEHLFEKALGKGKAGGVFDIDDVQLAAAMIKPLLQDWYVKRSKYRKRDVSVDLYIRTVSDFVLRAIGNVDARPGTRSGHSARE